MGILGNTNIQSIVPSQVFTTWPSLAPAYLVLTTLQSNWTSLCSFLLFPCIISPSISSICPSPTIGSFSKFRLQLKYWRLSLTPWLTLNKLLPSLLQGGSVSAFITIWTHLLHLLIYWHIGLLLLLLVQALGVQGLFCLVHCCISWRSGQSWNNEVSQWIRMNTKLSRSHFTWSMSRG